MAEMLTELPEDFLDEANISQAKKNVLIAQINRFNALKEQELNSQVIIDDNGSIVLPEGTIIHGTRPLYDSRSNNLVTLSSTAGIAQSGILTGQALGIGEDGETYYCADFFRVPKTMTIEEYGDQFTDIVGFTPFDRGPWSIAFIITPNPKLDELLSYDCYRQGTIESDITKTFINYLPRTGDATTEMSSILYGVPRNAITCLTLGDKVIEAEGAVNDVIQLFPDCYITNNKGKILYNPLTKEVNDTEEIENRIRR